MTDDGVRSSDEQLKLTYAARMLLVTAALFVAAGAVWLITGTGTLVGVAFVATGLAIATLARALRSRIGPRPTQPSTVAPERPLDMTTPGEQ